MFTEVWRLIMAHTLIAIAESIILTIPVMLMLKYVLKSDNNSNKNN